jgi:hypothetical protein
MLVRVAFWGVIRELQSDIINMLSPPPAAPHYVITEDLPGWAAAGVYFR